MEKNFYLNVKRITVIALVCISFAVAFGRIYCYYDDAFVYYVRYKGLSDEEVHKAFNSTQLAEEIAEKVAPGESILAVKQDPANYFLSYYLYPRKIYKYKHTYFRETTNTYEEIPEGWISAKGIDWILFEQDISGLKRYKK